MRTCTLTHPYQTESVVPSKFKLLVDRGLVEMTNTYSIYSDRGNHHTSSFKRKYLELETRSLRVRI
jgi:hypothetical protein